MREVKPPFSPDATVRQFAELLKSYRVTTIHSDRYGGDWPAERFRAHGIRVEPSEKVRSDIYLEMLPLLNARRVELLDNKRLITQLLGLERHTSPGGKDRIDHGRGSHDDLINAAAGALVMAAVRKSMVITQATLDAVSRQMPDKYGRPNRFTSRPMAPMTFVGSASNLAQPAAQGPAPSNSFGSVSYSDKFGNK